MQLNKDELLRSLPPEWPENLLPRIKTLVERSGAKIVVVDDDPTGAQTVYDVPVLTEWSPASLAAVLAEPGPLAYVLTNSRSLLLARAQAVNNEIGSNLRSASRATGRSFVVVSRSDSTLRGHYPGEVEALAKGLGQPIDGTLIVPFFLEGGRLTIDDVHYVAEGEQLVPAAETDYARDATFGYRASDLRGWVCEKQRGHIRPQDVVSITLADLRQGGPAIVADTLGQVEGGQVCIVNAASYRDVEVLVAGLQEAEANGKRFIYRTAASFVRVRAGIPARELLTAADLRTAGRENGGMIVAGSYIQKSTEQIELARCLPGVAGIEVSVEKLLDVASRDEEITHVASRVDETVAGGVDALVYTSRKLIVGADETSSLRIGQAVSAALVEIVKRLREAPAWTIAKGGITSSDIATQGLGVKRADVLGQALPGVPVWRLGRESRWPALIYVVFPGNVGGPEAIAQMVGILRDDARQSAG